MHKVVVSSMVTLVCLLTAGSVAAQNTRQQASGVTIRTSVQEVALDLIVRDSKGRVVKNLQASDVEIYEDGVRQDIKSFRLVNGKDLIQAGLGSKESKKSHTNKIESKPPASSNPLPAVNLVCIVFHNLDPYTKKYAVEAAQEFLKNDLQPNTWVAVFNLDTSFTVLHQFTSNRQELLQASAAAFTGQTVDFVRVADAVLSAEPNVQTIEVMVNGNPANGGSVQATQKISGGTINTRAVTGADVSNAPAANAVRGDLAGQRRAFGGIEGMRQMDQLEWMIGQLGALPGRKTVLFLSPGVATTGDVDLFQSVLNKANKAQVSVYGIDINGLSENSSTMASGAALSHTASLSSTQGQQTGISTKQGVAVTGEGSGGANMEKMRQGDYTMMAVRTSDTQASLRALSEGTGGFLIANTNDLRKPFTRILEDVDTHYEAVYHPASDKYDGRLRTIEVKSARGNLTLQSRTGYFALPAFSSSLGLAPFELTALAALNIHVPPHAFDFHAAALQFRPHTDASQQAVVFELPAAAFTATSLPNLKRHRLHVSVLALVKDATGQVVDKFSQDSPFEIPDENLAAMLKTTIPLAHAVTLPKGHYSVDAVVLDREANRASTAKFEFESRAVPGIGMSDVMLVQRVEPINGQVDAADPFQFQGDKMQGRRVVPELADSLNADAHPFVYFVVYPDALNSEKPKIQVEFLSGVKVLAQQTVDLPPPDASGAIPMVVGAASHAGKCELKITAIQGTSTATRTLAYTITPLG